MTAPIAEPNFPDVHNSAGLRLCTPPFSNEDNALAANYDFLSPFGASVMEESLDTTLPFSDSEMFTGSIQAPAHSDYSDSLYSAQTIPDVSNTYNMMLYGVSFGSGGSYDPSFNFSDSTQSTNSSANADRPLPLMNSFLQNQDNTSSTRFSINATAATTTSDSSFCHENGSTTSTKSPEDLYGLVEKTKSSPSSAVTSQSNTTDPTTSASLGLEHDPTVPSEPCQDDSVDSANGQYEPTSDYPLRVEQTHHVPPQNPRSQNYQKPTPAERQKKAAAFA
ncbi:hypothetical protein K435DRAFT_878086, partial [Dendrothele bispora CBS 962.96]